MGLTQAAGWPAPILKLDTAESVSIYGKIRACVRLPTEH